ncbi:hypothetical protein B7Y92_03105 [Candidatus Saccharibacteria bacterium 32-50-13]|nr:MAG: hypothetical protein B7Y92_03105 [Candidatus Saccharibacteria bacterium 32-50-13]
MQTTSDIIQQLFSNQPAKSVTKGEVVIEPADELADITYLESGRVIQYRADSRGNKSIVNVYRPGSFFPMGSALNHTPNRFYFAASQDSVVRTAPREEIVSALIAEPAIAMDLLARVYRGIDGLLGRMSLLLSGTARERVMYELMTMADRFGEVADEGIMISVTEDELGQHTGLTRETVSRSLSELARKDILSRSGKGKILLYRRTQ